MEGVREYLLSVTAAALLCGVVRTLCPAEQGPGSILKLICGIFLCFTVIRPAAQIRISELPPLLDEIHIQAQDAASAGQLESENALRESIIQRSEAYILDKADAWGADITLEFTLSDAPLPVPERVVVSGNLSPYAKTRVQELLETGLGIPKEDQLWLT